MIWLKYRHKSVFDGDSALKLFVRRTVCSTKNFVLGNYGLFSGGAALFRILNMIGIG